MAKGCVYCKTKKRIRGHYGLCEPCYQRYIELFAELARREIKREELDRPYYDFKPRVYFRRLWNNQHLGEKTISYLFEVTGKDEVVLASKHEDLKELLDFWASMLPRENPRPLPKVCPLCGSPCGKDSVTCASCRKRANQLSVAFLKLLDLKKLKGKERQEVQRRLLAQSTDVFNIMKRFKFSLEDIRTKISEKDYNFLKEYVELWKGKNQE